MPAALWRVSSYSRAGIEPAVMPLPTECDCLSKRVPKLPQRATNFGTRLKLSLFMADEM
jgi:hypothetical protein